MIYWKIAKKRFKPDLLERCLKANMDVLFFKQSGTYSKKVIDEIENNAQYRWVYGKGGVVDKIAYRGPERL